MSVQDHIQTKDAAKQPALDLGDMIGPFRTKRLIIALLVVVLAIFPGEHRDVVELSSLWPPIHRVMWALVRWLPP